MKINKLLVALLVLPLISSCGKVKVDNGTDAAKILLANERLDASVLQNSDSIFTKGKQAFARILNETRRFNIKYAGRPNETYTEINGDTIKWYNDVDYSNFNMFFESYTVNIEHSAKRGGELIDNTKKNIRVVDKWVEVGGTQYLLSVNEDSETIYYRDDFQVDMCKRYTDETGHDVYEMFTQNENASTRMKYIPGLVYEFSINSGGFEHYLFAENYKGYWTVNSFNGIQSYQVGDQLDEMGTISSMILKDEACYQFSTTVSNKFNPETDFVQIISADRKTDLIKISKNTFELMNTGIKGLDYIKITASESERDEYYGDPEKDRNTVVYEQKNVDSEGNEYIIYSTSGYKSATAVLENGLEFTEGDTFLNGQINVGRIDVGYVAGCDAYGQIPFRTTATTLDENFELIKTFLNQNGISFRRDLNTVLSSAEFALNDVTNYAKYYKWNDYSINNIEDLKLAAKAEKAKIDALIASYNAIKDKQVISYKDQKAMNENMYFADVTFRKDMVISNEGFTINLSESEVSVKDTLLFVDKEYYKLVLGLMNEEGVIIPLSVENENSTQFVKGSEFKTTQQLSVSIPELDEGKYVLVAYVATKDEGIRVTNPILVKGEFKQSNKVGTKFNETITTNEDKNLVLTVEESNDVYQTVEEKLTYKQLEQKLAEIAYQYGSLNDSLKVEEFKNNTWVVVDVKNNEDSLCSSGQYRLEYEVASSNTNGYVYLNIQ